jgi:hypothetical protein
MGRAARLRAHGVTGPGIGDGNPVAAVLQQRVRTGLAPTLRFSDRVYAVDAHGTYHRATTRPRPAPAPAPQDHADHPPDPGV